MSSLVRNFYPCRYFNRRLKCCVPGNVYLLIVGRSRVARALPDCVNRPYVVRRTKHLSYVYLFRKYTVENVPDAVQDFMSSFSCVLVSRYLTNIGRALSAVVVLYTRLCTAFVGSCPQKLNLLGTLFREDEHGSPCTKQLHHNPNLNPAQSQRST